jgi:hypothetical protein
MAVTLDDLRDEVLIIVRDDGSTAEEMADVKLNEALMAVADTVVIPELKRVGQFTTVVDQAWATMPTGFTGKLLFVGNDSTSLAVADGGVMQLMENNPLLDESGSVHTVALEGNIIYYQGIPSEATSFPILYTVWPDLMSGTVGVPDYIPAHLQRGLFVHHAAAMIFNTIEDGIEGEKVNMLAQLGLHSGYVDQFLAYI